jgi:hypothetical protein
VNDANIRGCKILISKVIEVVLEDSSKGKPAAKSAKAPIVGSEE